MKRIATLLFAFGLAASPAHASGIKGVAGTLGMGAISGILCGLTVLYDIGGAESATEGFDRRGFFAGVNGSYAGEDFSDRPVKEISDIFSNRMDLDITPTPGPQTTANADDGWSVAAHGGYRCHPRFSVGASLEFFRGFDTQWTGVLGTGGDDIDMFAATVDIKGYLLTGRTQPYLLFGGGTMNIDTKVTNRTGITGTIDNPMPPPSDLAVIGPVIQKRDYTDFVFRFGGGIDMYATEHVVVNVGASYLLPTGDVSEVNLFTVGAGIEYRF